jgi:hypothetical protein
MAKVSHNTAGLIKDPAAWLKLDNAARKKSGKPVLTLSDAKRMRTKAMANPQNAAKGKGKDAIAELKAAGIDLGAGGASQGDVITQGDISPTDKIQVRSKDSAKALAQSKGKYGKKGATAYMESKKYRTAGDMLKDYEKIDNQRLSQLQQQMFIGGFYDKGVDYGDIQFGARDDLTRNAYIRLLTRTARQNAAGTEITWQQVLDSAAQSAGANLPGSAAGAGQPLNIDLADPAALNSTIDQVSQAVLGRKATQDEKRLFVGSTHMQQRSNALTAAGPQIAGQGAAAVGAYGASLASKYGLAMTSHERSAQHNKDVGGATHSDHLTGMAVDLSGDKKKQASLYAWAKANSGPGGLFRYVANEGDHVHLSFNATAVGGNAMLAQGSGQGGTLSPTQIAQYAAKAGFSGQGLVTAVAVAMAESNGHVDAHNTNAKTGDNSYSLWQINMLGKLGPSRLKQFGLNSNDQLFDPSTNARAAFQVSGGGKSFRAWTTYTKGTYKKYLSAAQAAVAGAGGAPMLPADQVPGGPSITETVGIDPQADAEAQQRAANPVEAGAHDVAGQFSNFLKIIQGSGLGQVA